MNLSPRTVEVLRENGLDAIRVSEIMPPESTDEAVLKEARNSCSVLLTQDLDFSAILALGGNASPSVVAFRLAVPDPEKVVGRFLAIVEGLESDLRSGCIVTVEDRRVRIRLLPMNRPPAPF
jgi:predicted nuclease of predicted toxin-antitoxin system